METKQRIEWIDIAKGIGIILVVLGHCVVKSDSVHKFIFAFHMPLFFFLSGYCFHVEKYKSIREVFSARAKALLIPYMKLWLLGMIITFLIPEWRRALTLNGLLIDFYQGYPSLSNNTSIWYLISLFIVTIIFYIMRQSAIKVRKKVWLYWGVGLSGFFGYMVYLVKISLGVSSSGAIDSNSIIPGGRLPLTIDTSMTALVFFALGVWVQKKQRFIFLKRKTLLVIMSFLVTFIVSVFLNSRVNIHACDYGNILWFYIAAFSGIIMVIALSQILSENELIFIRKILVFYGRNSLLMFGTQSIYIHLYLYAINKITGWEYKLYETLPFQYGIIAFVSVTFICLPLTYCIRGNIGKVIRRENEKN